MHAKQGHFPRTFWTIICVAVWQNVLPYDPLVLMDAFGATLSTAACNDTTNIPLVNIHGTYRFACESKQTRPKPHVRCWCNGSFVLYPEELRRSNQSDNALISVRREIDVMQEHCHMLQCNARIPKPDSDMYENKTVCLEIKKAKINHTVTCRMDYGELGTIGEFQCSIFPNNTIVEFVEWHHGKRFDPVYRATPGGDIYDGPRGRFTKRNITGFFDSYNVIHTLIIYNPIAEDEASYFCVFHIKHRVGHIGRVHLKLAVKPKQLPAILKANGEVASTAICDSGNQTSVPDATIVHETSFFCFIGMSRPKPTAEWFYEGFSHIDEEIYNKSLTDGLETNSVIRQIDVPVPTIESYQLKCKVDIPDPRSGGLKKIYVCLRLSKGGIEPSGSDLRIYAVTILIPLLILVLLLLWAGRRYVKRRQLQGDEGNQGFFPLSSKSGTG